MTSNKPDVPEFTPEELDAARNALISRVTGIRPELVPYLRGDTVDEITASAAYMVKTLPHTRVGNAPADRVGRVILEAPASSASRDDVRDEDGRPDPEKLAAAIRQRMNVN